MCHQICDACETVRHCSKNGCIPIQPATAQASGVTDDATELLTKYKALCIRVGRGDSYHLSRIDAAIAALTTAARAAEPETMTLHEVMEADAAAFVWHQADPGGDNHPVVRKAYNDWRDV